MTRSKTFLTAALAASALLTSFAANADDRGRHSGRYDNDRQERHYDNRRDDRAERRDDRRNYRQGYRQGYRAGHWTAPSHHRFSADSRYRYSGNHPGFRYGWYNGRYGRYYYQPSSYYFAPYRGPHGALIISVPLW